jgi:alpha-1,2-mannosyltransferase
VTHTELPRDARNGLTSGRPGARVTRTAIGRPSAAWVVIAACAAVALFLRLYQLARPGYLLGVTEYDDGVLFGNALRLVAGVIPYRDFSMVQPPGGMLLMVPAALLAKVAGTAWGLAAARLLTVCADTANVVLLGVLVRHRGPLTAGIACGVYAVYPDAITAAHTFLLEPWLNLFCLAGAVLIFDGDRLVGTASRLPHAGARAARWPDTARLLGGGLLFGFAVAVKIWALVPLGIAGLLLLVIARRARPAAAFAGGAAVGLGVPLLPFAVLAPGALARGVLIGQVVRDANGPRHLLQRLNDLAGLGLHPVMLSEKLLMVGIAAGLIGCCLVAYLLVGRPLGDRRARALDGYALACAVAVTAMLLWPRLYYSHYGSFDCPFLALALALPIGLLPAPRPVNLRAAVAAALVLIIATAGYRQFHTESRLHGTEVATTADRLIPAGACVVTNDAAYTVAADRFYSDVHGCPEIVDSFGTFFAMTSGLFAAAGPAALQPVDALWQTALDRAQYVWLTTDTLVQIPWNRRLSGYFHRHFRLIGLAGSPPPYRNVPTPGLYART